MITGGMFSADSPTAVRGADKILPIDVYIPGCPPRPEAIIKLRKKISNEWRCCTKRENGKFYLSPIPLPHARLSMKTKAKANDRVRNWKEYNAALKQRGSITFWVNETVIEQWRNEQKTGRKGASNYGTRCGNRDFGERSNRCFIYRSRQAQGFLESLLSVMGIELEVPAHSTLSRRLGKLSVELPVVSSSKLFML